MDSAEKQAGHFFDSRKAQIANLSKHMQTTSRPKYRLRLFEKDATSTGCNPGMDISDPM